MGLNYQIQLAFNKITTDNWSHTPIWYSGMDFNTKEPKEFIRILILENVDTRVRDDDPEHVEGKCEIHIFNKMGMNISRVQDLADKLEVIFDRNDFFEGGLIIRCQATTYRYVGNFAPRNAGVIDTIESGLILFSYKVFNQGDC